MGMMLRSPRLDKDVSGEPAALDNEPGSGCKLANIFAQKPWRFGGEDSERARIAIGFVAAQERTLDFALLVDPKQILLERAKKTVRLPFRERRSNSETGERRDPAERDAHLAELVLQPRFQAGVQTLNPILLARYRVAAAEWLAFILRYNLTMKTLLTLIAVAFLGVIAVDAKTYKLPNDDFAIASIDMPDSWSPKVVENGIWGQTEDTAVYMSVVAVGTDKGMQGEIEDTIEMLGKHKVSLDDSTKKENKFKAGAFDATELLYQGKDEDGPAAVSITFVPIKDKMIIITYWVSTEKEKEHQKEVGTIVNSLKASS
jgi:hypothetical protein